MCLFRRGTPPRPQAERKAPRTRLIGTWQSFPKVTIARVVPRTWLLAPVYQPQAAGSIMIYQVTYGIHGEASGTTNTCTAPEAVALNGKKNTAEELRALAEIGGRQSALRSDGIIGLNTDASIQEDGRDFRIHGDWKSL